MNPNVDDFRLFYECLMKSAPEDYDPWLFKLQPKTKVPLMNRSWVAPGSKMLFKYAVKWMERGGNIGIAGRSFDALVNIDLDGDEEFQAIWRRIKFMSSKSICMCFIQWNVRNRYRRI